MSDIVLSANNPEAWTLGLLTRAQRGTPRMLRGTATAVAGALRYTTLREYRTSAGYIVPTGFVFVGLKLFMSASVAATPWFLADGTTDVGLGSAAAPAGVVRIDDVFAAGGNALPPTTANVFQEVDYYFTVPAGRYIAIATQSGDASAVLSLLGVEVAA